MLSPETRENKVTSYIVKRKPLISLGLDWLDLEVQCDEGEHKTLEVLQ